MPLEDVYWDLDPQEREAIRQAFRLTWEECLRAGVICLESGLDNLVWDSEKKAV
ncbi:hypothetical protein ASPWEDRAFT_167363 [Aspergillus wentii DTO 134E9]|uniref:Uncharacterized protein n=1 Tax=Aspergillus wentii DTO 134E9 TaxID=1073089 RepID=A0A1L9S2F4_ASPWE|nr:uncharacterized protein ASPWEDRAFT_167363 [Aspergillus wentii DTO 134E9]KAI9924387.1 hypothetical protein MW887_007013 [Aspergillus wentii]OJJ41342.1 hypothetical protein ASPWEDRAFT_167363 [Aspergillus wentii DTO 134E9]